ncbi:MAG: HNH endonuclease, partial [Actinomycetota bacterium]|nr:HNH endonuclease [Actinomycetota bacterium]
RASTICWLCGHDGADSVDHVIALANGGAPLDPNNLRPAHHLPCTTCAIRCNRAKGSGSNIPALPTSSAW